MGIPDNAFVVGHLGRLAPEKNLQFLATAVAHFIAAASNRTNESAMLPQVHCLVIGAGPSEADVRAAFAQAGLSERLHLEGVLNKQALADAYHAMDVFAFASTSETQGMVLTEAMAAGKPVVALDAAGAREIVQDTVNGRLLAGASISTFAAALQWVAAQSPQKRAALADAARATAEQFSLRRTAELALDCYRGLLWQEAASQRSEDEYLPRLLDLIKAEWAIIQGVAGAAGKALLDS